MCIIIVYHKDSCNAGSFAVLLFAKLDLSAKMLSSFTISYEYKILLLKTINVLGVYIYAMYIIQMFMLHGYNK